MAKRVKTAREMRRVRHRRIRQKVAGTAQRPRLSVFRSLQHVYAQIVDDDRGHTLASASSLDPEVAASRAGRSKTEIAKLVGGVLSRRAQEQGIAAVVFDRGGYRYHGRVRALADTVREGGLRF